MTPSRAVLAIDQGTTNTKATLVDADGRVLARASRTLTLSHPQPGWAEQSAEDIWRSVVAVIGDVREAAPTIVPAALAIGNQRETIILWDAPTGRAVAPAISWQCRRSSDRCAALREAGHGAMVVARTGLGLDPLFPATKLAWLLDHVPGARAQADAGTLRAGTVDSWLLWRLTGGAAHATDRSNASRTQLLDLRTFDWDPTLADLFGVPLALLPTVRASDSLFGQTAPGIAALPAGIPIHAMMGDSHAALFGHGATGPGMVKVTIGTGSSVMTLMPTPLPSAHGLSTTVAWSSGGQTLFALEGNITVSGHAAAFARRLLGVADENALSDLAQQVPNSGGVVFVPALAGLGAPHLQDRAQGLVTGMTLGTRPAHVARATFEAIAMQIVDVFEAMEADVGDRLDAISADGGAARNDFLLQLLADLLDRPVMRPTDAEVGALGVARMAQMALGLGGTGDERRSTIDRFSPRMVLEQRHKIRAAWRSAIRRASAVC